MDRIGTGPATELLAMVKQEYEDVAKNEEQEAISADGDGKQR